MAVTEKHAIHEWGGGMSPLLDWKNRCRRISSLNGKRFNSALLNSIEL
jgi:hypothetical protein